MRLKALITTWNEEDNLPDCLSSLSFTDEIWVVDSFSDDRSPEIAREAGAKFFQREYRSPSDQKNWALDRMGSGWILILDADERVTPELRREIEAELRNPRFDAYWIPPGGALLAEGKYDILYAVKKGRIPDIGNCPGRDAVVAGYLQAVELKEWGDFQPLENFDIAAGYETVRELFVRFLPWYRSQVPAFRHTAPSWIRERLCTALLELLQGKPGMPPKLFYKLQRRFS